MSEDIVADYLFEIFGRFVIVTEFLLMLEIKEYAETVALREFLISLLRNANFWSHLKIKIKLKLKRCTKQTGTRYLNHVQSLHKRLIKEHTTSS